MIDIIVITKFYDDNNNWIFGFNNYTLLVV
jgi:hypothetical protein